MCCDAHLDTNPFGDLIAETPSSYVRPWVNQTQAGYVVVVATRHAPQIHHMTPAERSGFFGDVAAIGEAISVVLNLGDGWITSIEPQTAHLVFGGIRSRRDRPSCSNGDQERKEGREPLLVCSGSIKVRMDAPYSGTAPLATRSAYPGSSPSFPWPGKSRTRRVKNPLTRETSF